MSFIRRALAVSALTAATVGTLAAGSANAAPAQGSWSCENDTVTATWGSYTGSAPVDCSRLPRSGSVTPQASDSGASDADQPVG
ncbi:hypothetical protein PSD17_10140 [Pseudonocardia sp. D17]|nr:hypothetical protein PSD17_10140 [Pseudonocardia sp. D17]